MLIVPIIDPTAIHLTGTPVENDVPKWNGSAWIPFAFMAIEQVDELPAVVEDKIVLLTTDDSLYIGRKK